MPGSRVRPIPSACYLRVLVIALGIRCEDCLPRVKRVVQVQTREVVVDWGDATGARACGVMSEFWIIAGLWASVDNAAGYPTSYWSRLVDKVTGKR